LSLFECFSCFSNGLARFVWIVVKSTVRTLAVLVVDGVPKAIMTDLHDQNEMRTYSVLAGARIELFLDRL